MFKSTLLSALCCAILNANPALSQFTNLPDVKPGVFNVSTRIEIHNTTVDAAWDALADFSNYATWNPFVRYAVVTSPLNLTMPEQRPAEGKNAFFRVQIPPLPLPVNKDTPDNILNTKTSYELITAVQRDLGRMAWIYYPPSDVMNAERWQSVTDLGNGTVLYESREVFGGTLAHLVQATLEDGLKESFKAQGEGLKLYLEGQ